MENAILVKEELEFKDDRHNTKTNEINSILSGLSIEEGIECLTTIKQELEECGYTNLQFASSGGYDYQYLSLVGSRPENEQEKKRRLKEESKKEKQAKEKEKKDRQLFEKMKKEYGW